MSEALSRRRQGPADSMEDSVLWAGPGSADPPASIASDFVRVRDFSETLCESLEPEDLGAQSMADTSPGKWHLAHTSWFFEAFLLGSYEASYRPFHPAFNYLFNSYYNAAGARHERPLRGVLTRPTLSEVLEYRAHVDRAVTELLATNALDKPDRERAHQIIRVGLHHEQQHQELILTDLKHLFSLNTLEPAYRDALPVDPRDQAGSDLGWLDFGEGVHEIGCDKNQGQDQNHSVGRPGWADPAPFSFDNERPRHRVFLEPHALTDRLITNAEYLAFIEDGGYRESAHWLDRGWATVKGGRWEHPLYWRPIDGGYAEFTLAGRRDFAPHEPVSHLSLFEADAFARWAGARLPSEAEWEHAAVELGDTATFVEGRRLQPCGAEPTNGRMRQAFGEVWEWTCSSYGPYPGYRPEQGALGEYNGKFMCEQTVLRGGSCATARSHIRPTYRNFFYAPDRWQFSGLRLAKDL